MSNELIEVPFDENPGDQAVLLLAAAEEMKRDPGEVATVTGGFMVPEDIAVKAGLVKKPAKSETKKPTSK